MTESFTEYRDISVASPLRQGDILEAVAASASQWRRHLVVITADCDLAHDKHHGRVTCVPLLTAHEYLMETQIPRLREKFIAKTVATLRSVLPSGRGSNISDERLQAWPCEADPDEIVTSLALNGGAATVAKAALESIRIVSQETSELNEAVEVIITASLAAPNAQKRQNIVQQITNTLKGPYSQPPGDALFISTIASGYDLGYFAYLRHLEQVRHVEIATSPTRNSVSYRRISRLQDRYTHALVQRFALVFMSIGLPKEYEEIRDLHSEIMAESYQ